MPLLLRALLPSTTILVLLVLLVLLASPLALPAQTRPSAVPDAVPAVPREMLPPPGKCRIWIAGVPAKQQPAPTECAVALRQNPSNGTVLYGPAPTDDDDGRFDLKFGSETSPRPSALRATPATDRRDSVKAKPAPEKKPSEPTKKKPEKP